MECKHERIKSVNCVIFCDVCGAKLPVDFLVAKERIKAQNEEKPQEAKPEEAPKETKKRTTTRKGGK